jgi:hypothetical protein
MRDDQLAGTHDAHVEDKMPWWGWMGLGALAFAGAFTAAIWIERFAPNWL